MYLLNNTYQVLDNVLSLVRGCYRRDICTLLCLDMSSANIYRKCINIWCHEAPDLMSMHFLYSMSTYAIQL